MNETETISAFKIEFPSLRFAVGWLHDCIYFNLQGGGRGDSVRVVQRVKYMERWVIRIGWFTVRRHRIYRGDDRLHDHPFWFITFPLAEYSELVLDPKMLNFQRFVRVKPFRLHFRRRDYRHRIVDVKEPVDTLVFTGPRDPENRWGFYDERGSYIPHEMVSRRIGDGGPSG